MDKCVDPLAHIMIRVSKKVSPHDVELF